MKILSFTLFTLAACLLLVIPNGLAVVSGGPIVDGIKLKRVKSSQLTVKSHKAIRQHRSGSFKSLEMQGGKILANPEIAIFVKNKMTLIVPTADLKDKALREFVLNGLDINTFNINGILVTMTCSCGQKGIGRDDCEFVKDSTDEMLCMNSAGECVDGCKITMDAFDSNGNKANEVLAN